MRATAMRNRLFLPVALLLLAALAGCQLVQPAVRDAAPVTITILHQNDVHGAILPATVALADGGTRQQGGMVTLSRYVAKYRAANPGRTLFFNAGDWFQGTPEGNESKGESMVDLFNALQLDAAAPGNHEFDFGADNFARLAGLAQFPVLAGNLEEAATGQRPAFLTQTVWRKEIDGVVVLAFGLLTRETASATAGDVRDLYRVTDEVAAARAAVETYRDQCDVLICLSHSGVDVDREIARQVPGLDLIIGGHSHTFLETPYIDTASGVVVVQAGGKGAVLGKFDLQYDRAARRISGFTGSLVPLNDDAAGLPAADATFVARVTRWTEPVASMMAQVYGRTAVALTRRDLAAAPASSLLGNWLGDVMRSAAGADIAFHNRTGIRAEIPAGPVTARHLYEVSPFGNELAVVRLTGAQVRQVVTYALSEQRYFLEAAGILVKYAPAAGGKFAVRAISVAGRPLQDDRIYSVVTNDFIAGGGDGHVTFRAGQQQPATGIKLLDATRAAVQAVREISPARDNRFVRVR